MCFTRAQPIQTVSPATIAGGVQTKNEYSGTERPIIGLRRQAEQALVAITAGRLPGDKAVAAAERVPRAHARQQKC
jgi:hypothetical protein